MIPQLSLIIPTKNRPDLLTDAVVSALAALPSGGELIVVDDRSLTPASQIVAGIFDPRLKVLLNEGAPGPGGARNFGVATSRGEIILFLDDDDLMLPGYPNWILSQASGVDAPEFGFSATLSFGGPTPPAPFFKAGTVVWLAQLGFRHRLAAFSQGFWVQRNVFQRLGGIDEALRTNEDTEFSLRLIRDNVPGIFSTAPGVMVRRHARTSAALNLGHLTHLTSHRARAGYFYQIVQKHAEWLSGQPEARLHLMKRHLKLLAKTRDFAAVRSALCSPAAAGFRFRLGAWWFANALYYRLRGG